MQLKKLTKKIIIKKNKKIKIKKKFKKKLNNLIPRSTRSTQITWKLDDEIRKKDKTEDFVASIEIILWSVVDRIHITAGVSLGSVLWLSFIRIGT